MVLSLPSVRLEAPSVVGLSFRRCGGRRGAAVWQVAGGRRGALHICLLGWRGYGSSAMSLLYAAVGLDLECGAAAAGSGARHPEVTAVECVQPMSRQICIPAGLVLPNQHLGV